MGLEALLRGWVSRALPQAETDNDPGVVRLARYGEVYGVQLIRKQHALVDEGSYFVTNNAQTGLATSLLGTTFAQTTLSPTLHIYNGDSPGNLNNKRIHIDFVTLVVTATGAASAGTTINFAWSTDVGNRYSSGGTVLTPNIVNPNTDLSPRASVAAMQFGALTLIAATNSARIIVGQRNLRNVVSATVSEAVGDTHSMNFGGVESAVSIVQTVASPMFLVYQIPGISIGPNTCAILHLWAPGGALTTGISYTPEIAWWER